MIPRAGLITCVLLVLSTASVAAATREVLITSTAGGFMPPSIRAAIGDTVRWTNHSTLLHSTTGDAPLALWSLDIQPAGGQRSRDFEIAGGFPYHCRFHASMTGVVKVPIRVTPGSGPAGSTFTIRVADVSAPSGFQYVIQRKRPGGSFQAWRTITGQTTAFSTQVTGTWQFRSRLRRISDGAASGWSPKDTAQVT
jgi:plastocyanin